MHSQLLYKNHLMYTNLRFVTEQNASSDPTPILYNPRLESAEYSVAKGGLIRSRTFDQYVYFTKPQTSAAAALLQGLPLNE